MALNLDMKAVVSRGQTKKHSLVESIVNVLVGYIINIGVQSIVFPLFNMYISFYDNLLVGLIFTVVSILRSYYLRRLFNKVTEYGQLKF